MIVEAPVLDSAEPIAVVRPRRSKLTPFRRLGAWSVVFFTPSVLLLAVGTQWSWLDNTIDPFIYVGVTERLQDYLTRWPQTYYAYRFGYVVPAQASAALFGDIGGYLVLRAVLFGAMGLLVWPRRARGERVQLWPAVLGAGLLALTPVLQRALLTTYVPTATAFFLVSMALLAPIRGRRDAHLGWFAASGSAAALAWNSHPTVLPVLLACGAVLFVDQAVEGRFRNLGPTVVRGVVWIAAMAATVGVAWVYLGVRYGAWDLYGSAFNQASKNTDSVFLEDTATWFTWRHYLLIGPLAVIAGLVAHRVSDDPGVRRSLRRLVLACVTALLVFAAFQWLLATPLMSIYYYSCIPLSLAALLLGRSAASLVAAQPARRQPVLALGSLLLFAGAILVGREIKLGYTPIALLVIAAGVVAAVVAVRFAVNDDPRSLRPALSVMAIVIALAGYVAASSPHDFPPSNPGFKVDPLYDSAMFTYDQSTLDVYRLAHEYAEFVPQTGAEPGNFRVWFRLYESGYTNQVQATLVHGMSALQPFPAGGLPELTDFEISRIQQENLRFVILVDSDPAVVQAGVTALEGAGLGFSEKRTETFGSGDIQVTSTVLERPTVS